MDFYSVASSRPFTHGQISWKLFLLLPYTFCICD